MRKKNVGLRVPYELRAKINDRAHRDRDTVTRICERVVRQFCSDMIAKQLPATGGVTYQAAPVGDDLARLQFWLPVDLCKHVELIAKQAHLTHRSIYYTILATAFV